MAKPDFVLGVDPGLGGALAVFDARTPHPDTPSAHAVYDMPTTRLQSGTSLDAVALAALIGEIAFNHPGIVAVVENVHSMPRQAGAFSFGLYTGMVHGALAAHGIPITLVSPSKWKPAMGLSKDPVGGDKASTKSKARAVAAKLFPDIAHDFARVRDDGRAEALLLAVYASHTVFSPARKS